MSLRLPPGLIAACCTCFSCFASSAAAEPFLTRDQNPLLAGFGLPLPVPSQLPSPSSTRVGVLFNWSNTANSEQEANEALLMDLESREMRLLIEHAFPNRWSLRLQIPYRRLHAGTLDGFIDGWHDTLGLPEGARTFLPRNQFRLAYFRENRAVLDLHDSISGFGDIAIEGGYQWWQAERSAASLWLSIEAPTGSSKRLLGNGAWDVGLYVAGQYAVGARGMIYWQAGGTWLGNGGPLVDWQRDWIASALAAFEYGVWRGLHLKAQVDAHSTLYDSDIDLLGSAVILTVGGEYRFTSGWRLDIGVSEDIQVGASPDVTFTFALIKSF